jgi:hypothetical protein
VLADARPPLGVRAQSRPSLEIADVVRAHGEDFMRTHALTPEQQAVLRDIARCRTAELGGHIDVCAECGHVEGQSYNSCRNRHCPKCQSLAQFRWVERRMERMLPTHSFHVVFTLPRELRRLALANREAVFNLLFACAADTLIALGRDGERLGGDLGITSVLHTWQRDLRFHPHAHCIVTGGGLSQDGQRWVAAPRDYLFPVRVMGALFRGKFIDALQRARVHGELKFVGPAAPLADRERFGALCKKLWKKRWLVYCKPPFGDNEQVFRYLGQYTHRVGISNHRLISLDEHGVTFRTRGDAKVTLAPNEFLRRFVLHVLPKGFVKIRHYGLFAASNVGTKLAAARALLGAKTPAAEAESVAAPRDFREILLALTGVDLRRCSRCGALAVVRLPLDEAGPPPHAQPPIPPDTS